MSLAVDRYELGPIGTNCYLVRASAEARELVVIDPGGDADKLHGGAGEIRLDLRRDPHHPRALGSPRRRRRSGRARRSRPHGGGRTGPPREDQRVRPASSTSVRTRRTYCSRATRHSSSPESTFETLQVPGHSPAHLAYAAERLALLGRRPLRGLGRAHRLRRFGDWPTLEASIGSCSRRFPPETVVYPGHGPATTLGDELATNPFLAELRAAREPEVRGAARNARHPAGGAAALATRSRGAIESRCRALRLPAHPDAGLRGHRALRAHVRARARTSSRRRCTRSPTAATAR